MSIAVLLTCHNRRDITLRCLNKLYSLSNDMDVFVVDDASTDGTATFIKEKFPQVKLIHGTGQLFWNRGMHLAWVHASVPNYDYYFWLNDDVVLYDHCISEVLDCLSIVGNHSIVSGIIENHDKSRIIYGGSSSNKEILVGNGQMQEISHLNGNFVVVTKEVYDILGNLDPVFHHDLGDVDYGFRAKKHHIKVYTTRIPVGSCETNDICRVRLSNSTIRGRFKRLFSPLGSHPAINFYFRRKHYGLVNAIGYTIFLILLNIMPDSVVKFLFGRRYM